MKHLTWLFIFIVLLASNCNSSPVITVATPKPTPTATATPTATPIPDEAKDVTDSKTVTTNNNRGVSYILQMCSANAKEQKKFWKQAYDKADVWNAGWLYGNTSNPNGCTWSSKFMAMNVKKRVRVHICNSTCFPERRRHCQQNECFPDTSAADASKKVLAKDKTMFKKIDAIINLAKQDIALAPKGTLIDYAVSSCLECTLTTQARKYLNEYVKSRFKDVTNVVNGVTFVDNPYGSSCLDGYLCEKHGTPSANKKGIADNDGADYDVISQVNYWKNNTKAWMVLAWKPCLNGTKSGEAFIAPQKRTTWCSKSRDAVDFSTFTNKSFTATPSGDVASADKAGCSSWGDVNFVWKLSDGREFTTWLAPANLPKFSKVELRAGGKVIDTACRTAGKRCGSPYTHDEGAKRKIYDFNKHWHNYPDNAVLYADGRCWKLPKPSLRPVAK